jgi:hypothetical protein
MLDIKYPDSDKDLELPFLIGKNDHIDDSYNDNYCDDDDYEC